MSIFLPIKETKLKKLFSTKHLQISSTLNIRKKIIRSFSQTVHSKSKDFKCQQRNETVLTSLISVDKISNIFDQDVERF